MAAANLAAVAKKCFEVAPAATEADISAMLVAVAGANTVPDFLRSFWVVGAEWHSRKDHCDVYGLNIRRPSTSWGLDIFGDQELVDEWAESHGPNSAVARGMFCFAATSEYDFYFTSLDKNSPTFNKVIHIVNNCDEEDAPVEGSSFVGAAITYINAINPEDEEPAEFQDYFSPLLEKSKRPKVDNDDDDNDDNAGDDDEDDDSSEGEANEESGGDQEDGIQASDNEDD